MINIDRHIEILLLDNDCVFVPGLGGFIAHYVEAQYDESTDSFLPPLRTLGFNAKLNINDFLLAQSYIESYDISYPEALRRIEEEVAELNDMLREHGRCELSNMGVLYINDDGNIEFLPCQAGILTPDLYGLGVIECLDVSKSENTVVESDQESRNDDIHIGGEVVVGNADNEADGDTDEPRLSIRLSTLRYVAATAAAILLLFMVSQPLGNSGYTESAVGTLYHILPEDAKHTIVSATENTVEQNMPEAEKATEAPTPSEVVEKTTVPAPEVEQNKVPVPHFVIVVVSRITKENAIAYAAQLTKEGYPSEAVIRPNGAKVVYGNYSSEESAREGLRKFRDADERFHDAWVMEMK